MGRSGGKSRRRSHDCSRERSRKREQSKDQSREGSREHVREYSRDRSRDRARDVSRDHSRERRKRDWSRERVRYEERGYSRDRSYSRERLRRCEYSAESSMSEDLRAKVKRLERELKNVQSRPVNDDYTVPKFDPSRDNADIEQWVRQVDRLARRYLWSDDNILLVIARNLKGHARREYDEEMKHDHTWRSLKTILIRRFKRPLPFARLLKEAATYTASPGQKLGDYCFEKLSKLRSLKLEIPDAYLEDAIIGGIGDEHIERTIRSNRYEDVNELYATMNEMGSMPRVTSNKVVASQPTVFHHGGVVKRPEPGFRLNNETHHLDNGEGTSTVVYYLF